MHNKNHILVHWISTIFIFCNLGSHNFCSHRLHMFFHIHSRNLNTFLYYLYRVRQPNCIPLQVADHIIKNALNNRIILKITLRFTTILFIFDGRVQFGCRTLYSVTVHKLCWQAKGVGSGLVQISSLLLMRECFTVVRGWQLWVTLPHPVVNLSREGRGDGILST